MQYRIKKTKENDFIPQRRGWSTLWLWEDCPELSWITGLYGDYRFFGYGGSPEAAEKVIAYYKELETKKEEIINV